MTILRHPVRLTLTALLMTLAAALLALPGFA